MRELENKIEQSILRDDLDSEASDHDDMPIGALDLPSDFKRRKGVSLTRVKAIEMYQLMILQDEIAQVRKQLAEVEMKSADTIHDVRVLFLLSLRELYVVHS